MFSTYIRPGEHDFGAFSQSFHVQVRVRGSGGQISKVILIFQNLYQIVQFDELSLIVQYFSDLTFLSQVTAKNSAKLPKSMDSRGKVEIYIQCRRYYLPIFSLNKVHVLLMLIQ